MTEFVTSADGTWIACDRFGSGSVLIFAAAWELDAMTTVLADDLRE